MSEWKETDIGTIPFDWDILPLTKLIKFTVDNRGKTVPIVDEETKYALIATNCIKESALFPVKENLRFLTEETYQSWFRSHPLPGDIIIVNKGTPGLVCMTPDPVDFCIAQDMIALRVNEKVYNNYLFAYMRTEFFKYQVKSLNVGTTIPHLKKTNFKELKIPIPPLQEQKMIGDLYYRLSYKIENLRRQNETLERIAQTVFKHWFVDFDFPNEDGKPYKSSGGAMERSELGEIPAGWIIGALGDFCNIKHGYAFKGEFITTDETDQILLTPGNFRIGGGFNSSKYKYYSDNNYDQEYILESGDLIVTMTDLSKEGDTLGYPAFVPKNGNNVFLHNQRLGKVVNSQIDLFFLFFLLCRREYRSHILGTASGSTVRHTSPSRILEYKFTVPSMKLLDQFSLVVSQIIGKSFFNREQISTLDKIRDTLLPKLMSGQIRLDHMEED